MKRVILKTLPFVLFTFLCHSQTGSALKTITIDSLMRAHIVHRGKKPVHNFLLYLKNEKTSFEIHRGVGTVGRNNTAIDADYQYNVASITKTMVAAVVLQLFEEQKLDVKEPIKKYLEPIDFIRYHELHIYKGKPYQDKITIAMLLNHTSGISDVFVDAETRFNLSVLLHPKRMYTPQRFYKRYFRYNLNKKPANTPGKGYHYSDINYMLLGFIIEHITKKPLQEVLRERILEPLNMTNTYFEHYEEVHGHGKRIDAFMNSINITKRINTSYEWAGGGIVSTTKEMALFIKALWEMTLFKNEGTLEMMLDITATAKHDRQYGLGIFKWNFDNKTFYGHGGFYGSILAYAPEHGIIISANIGQAFPSFSANELLNTVINIASEK